MAVPGDEACRPIVPCGAAPWGDIPVDGTPEYVDQQYRGGSSRGTTAAPRTTVHPRGGAAATAAP